MSRGDEMNIEVVKDTLRAEIERLVNILDTLEGEPDLEPVGDELDASFMEWTSDPRQINDGRGLPFEDAEDDDPGGGNVLDEPHDAKDEDNGIADWDGVCEQFGGKPGSLIPGVE